MAKHRLPKRIDPVAAFQVATSYHHTILLMQAAFADNLDAIATTSLPQMMLTAFTCELYMKAAYAAENNGRVIEAHELNVLSGRLSRPFQDAVRSEWPNTTAPLRKQFPKENLDLDANLRVSRDAFENFRYFHEGKAKNFLIYNLPTVLRTVLLSVHPRLGQAPPILSPNA